LRGAAAAGRASVVDGAVLEGALVVGEGDDPIPIGVARVGEHREAHQKQQQLAGSRQPHSAS
jgi:hypothetical protein